MKNISKKIKYAIFDLDGTLLTDDKKLTNKTIEAIKWLQNKGVKIGIATGRPFYLALEIIEQINPDLWTISINGNLIYDHINKKSYQIKHHNQKNIEKFISFAKDNNLNYLLYTNKDIKYAKHIKSKHIDWLKKNIEQQPSNCKTPFFPLQDIEQKVFKVLMIIKDNKNYNTSKIIDFCKKLDDTYHVFSQKGLLDLMPNGINKETGLQFLQKKGLINLSETIIFGDSNNDIEMLKSAAISIAMKNGTRQVKNISNIITKYSNNEEGVARFINDFF